MFHIAIKPKSLLLACGLASLLISLQPGYAGTLANDPYLLDTGFRRMYNLDFPAAHKIFEGWQELHPDDPLGAAFNACAFLFAEFERLHILELDLFTDNKGLDDLLKSVPDP